MNDLITTTEAARLAGVGVSSIKRWADQALIQVVRTPGGHRRVVKADFLRFLQDAGSPSRRSVFSTDLASTVETDTLDPPVETPNALGAFWADEFLRHDEYHIQASLLNARGRLGSWFPASDEACLGLREIGYRWQRGEISVVDEHIASERINRALSTITRSMPSASSDPVCVLACTEDESHTLGLSFLQVCFREAGWHPLWVGANTPVEHLQSMILIQDIDLLALSASESSTNSKRLKAFADKLGNTCSEANTKLVLGGSGDWPNAPSVGFRFHSFMELSSYLRSLS